ncbi:hypothetical protein H920_06615 [Fukomys damarensis]|uniref:Uncharacterized protein n=1 Tax=Fukomys damarensis TaxID=885580 RepID=A0A091E9Z6_FUKDA|nr:hypothetical protein H920_06615 [Fukomys damarensis]
MDDSRDFCQLGNAASHFAQKKRDDFVDFWQHRSWYNNLVHQSSVALSFVTGYFDLPAEMALEWGLKVKKEFGVLMTLGATGASVVHTETLPRAGQVKGFVKPVNDPSQVSKALRIGKGLLREEAKSNTDCYHDFIMGSEPQLLNQGLLTKRSSSPDLKKGTGIKKGSGGSLTGNTWVIRSEHFNPSVKAKRVEQMPLLFSACLAEQGEADADAGSYCTQGHRVLRSGQRSVIKEERHRCAARSEVLSS